MLTHMRHTTDNCASSCTAQTVADYQNDPRFQAPKQKTKKLALVADILLSALTKTDSVCIYTVLDRSNPFWVLSEATLTYH